jgi:hypothetical protein
LVFSSSRHFLPFFRSFLEFFLPLLNHLWFSKRYIKYALSGNGQAVVFMETQIMFTE